MLKWIRGKRLDLKTTVVLLALAAAFWAAITYVNARHMVPQELQERWDSAGEEGPR